MGVLNNSMWNVAAAGAGEFYTHQIANSCRFNKADSPYLYWAPSAGGDQKTWAISFWVKRAGLGLGSWGNEYVMAWDDGASGGAYSNIIMFHRTGDKLDMGTGATPSVQTNLSYRDLTGWYHIAILADTTQATDTNRWKIYTNGVEQSLGTSNYPDQNYDFVNVASSTVYIGKGGGSAYSAGSANLYLAEMAFVEGTASSIGDFGEFKNGVWIPKDLSGLTFGDEGWWLKFQNSAALGDDSSGNDNDFTVSGLAAHDQMLDSPTFNSSSNGGNWCVFNALNNHNSDGGTDVPTLHEGGLESEDTGGTYSNFVGTHAVSGTGKWYYEYRVVTAVNNGNRFGWIDLNQEHNVTRYGGEYPGGTAGSWTANNNGVYSKIQFSNNNSTFAVEYTGAAQAAGDKWCVGVDLSTGKWYVSKNAALDPDNAATSSASSGTVELHANLDGGLYAPSGGEQGGSDSHYNFGQDSTFGGTETAGGNADTNGYGNFFYAVPSGYQALCAANLATPAADPAEDEGPEKYFEAKAYTGDGATTLAITGLGFQPDFTWIKNRDQADGNVLVDSTRGVTKVLASETTAAESTDADTLKTFTSDGFTVGADVKVNTSTEKYVSWNWKINGGTTSTNDTGDVDTTVQVDADRGISLFTYTSNNANATFGHGLGAVPEVIIVKKKSNTQNWPVYHQYVATDPATDYMLLDDTAGTVDDAEFWNDTAPTSTVLTLGLSGRTNGDDGATYFGLAFTSKEGFSKFGGYVGNGSTDGPFIYCGFRPSLVVRRRYDASTSGSWLVKDDARNPINDASIEVLNWNQNSAENAQADSSDGIDFCATGFKLRASNNGSNGADLKYVFMAWAATPFKYSTAF